MNELVDLEAEKARLAREAEEAEKARIEAEALRELQKRRLRCVISIVAAALLIGVIAMFGKTKKGKTIAIAAVLTVLAAALGNPDITPDALGPLAAESILVTRHLKEQQPEDFAAFCSLALCRPGVLGTSGMESALQVKTLCAALQPDLVLVIDALAGAEADHLCRTLQITDSGIAPGSGVGNNRPAFSRESLGIPVVAVGMPTVVDAGLFGGENLAGMFVTPRSIDSLVRAAGRVIGYAVDLALHRGLTVEDVDALLG